MKSNIKEEYNKPLIEIVELCSEDVVITSGTDDPVINPPVTCTSGVEC